MSDDMVWISLLRMAERLLAVGIGGVSIYLGFRLFIAMPQLAVGDADIKLPGGISILVSRVGPGVFFSLFGAVIVSLALYLQIKLPLAEDGGPVVLAVRGGDGDQARLAAERGEVERTAADLEQVTQLLAPDADQFARIDALNAIRDARIALVESVWGSDWGEDVEAFRAWAQSGAADVPAGVPWVGAAAIFKQGNRS